MEVDNWQIDINATESSTKDASELEKLWTATAEAAGGSITVRLWKWHQERTMKQFVCTWSHYILDFFGGNLCRNCGATHTQHDRRRYRFSSRAPWLKLRCADSHLSLFRLPVHTGQTEPNEAKKKIWYTHGFFCNAPSNEVIKHLSQDQKTGWQECCSVSENCVPPVIISWRVIFFLNRRKKVWWRDVLHNNTIEKWEPTTASARP